jgi:bifunctional DNA-binding transcriptional regulator/antitoxin component of YhaV-PrlF toxin-antitoxin module
MLVSKEKVGLAVFMAYLRCEGRITLPKELRDAYGLKEGDLVECQIRKIR